MWSVFLRFKRFLPSILFLANKFKRKSFSSFPFSKEYSWKFDFTVQSSGFFDHRKYHFGGYLVHNHHFQYFSGEIFLRLVVKIIKIIFLLMCGIVRFWNWNEVVFLHHLPCCCLGISFDLGHYWNHSRQLWSWIWLHLWCLWLDSDISGSYHPYLCHRIANFHHCGFGQSHSGDFSFNSFFFHLLSSHFPFY